jgi:putative intracellular protease/amidase
MLMKALILIADGFDDLQLFCPYYRLLEQGVSVTIASPRGHQAVGLRGFAIEADTPLAAVDPAEYDLLVIPGGQSQNDRGCGRRQSASHALSWTRSVRWRQSGTAPNS